MSPPRWARWVLGRTVPTPDRDDVVSNLDEPYAFRRSVRSRPAVVALRQAVETLAARFAPRGGPVEPTSGAAELMSQFFEDIHFALRSLRNAPGFLVAVVGTLALGLGANAVIFAVVHASILRPLSFPEPDELVWVWPHGDMALTLAQFEQLRPQITSAEIAAFAFRGYAVQGGEAPREVTGVSVSINHFDVFGVHPALGRALRPEDALPGAEPVAVISHELWHAQFGDDSTILGRRVDLFTAATIPMVPGAFTGSAHTVVGVLPPSYRPFGFQAEQRTVWHAPEIYFKMSPFMHAQKSNEPRWPAQRPVTL